MDALRRTGVASQTLGAECLVQTAMGEQGWLAGWRGAEEGRVVEKDEGCRCQSNSDQPSASHTPSVASASPGAPGSNHQDTPRPAITGLGDRAALAALACRSLGRHKTDVGHE